MSFVPPSARQIPPEVVGSLAGWFTGGSGPGHGYLDTAIMAAGIAPSPEAPNKVEKVKRAFAAATFDQGIRLISELIHILRDRGFMDWPENRDVLTRTRGAVALMGGLLSEEGFLSWSGQSGGSSSPAAQPIVSPPMAAPSAASSGLSLPTNERLISILRRVPEAFQPLVRPRRSGHDSLVLRDEYDLQDVVEASLRLVYDDVAPEERTPSFAGSSTTPDFLLREVGTMVEIKVTRAGRGNRVIKDEITIDSESYRAHQGVRRMVFVVYDLASTIVNPRGFESDLSQPINGTPRDVLVVPWPY